MQECCDDRITVEFVFRENAGDFKRVRKIGIAGCPLLRAVGAHRKDIGAVEHIFVRTGIVRTYIFDKLKLTDHRVLSPLSH